MHALDVAASLLGRKGPMDAMKLQKLVYYSQAWALTLLQRSLFAEEIQAWTYGPVVYELFRQHRGKYVVSTVDGDSGPLAADPNAHALTESVLGYYGQMSGARLSELTHSEAPWKQARASTPEGAPSQAVITNDSMIRYYSELKTPFLIKPLYLP